MRTDGQRNKWTNCSASIGPTSKLGRSNKSKVVRHGNLEVNGVLLMFIISAQPKPTMA